MDIHKTGVTAGILIAVLIVGAGCSTAADWEYRGRVDMVGPVERNVSLMLLTEVRSKNDLHTRHESHFDIGLEWKPRQWLAVGPYYRHVTEQTNGAWRVEHRPHLDVTFGWGSGWMSLSNRNRLEYRMIDGHEAFRFRFRLMLRVSSRSLPGIQPYISEEPYYDFEAGEVNKNRLIAGLDVKVLSTVRIGMNYVLDSVNRAGHWQEINALTMVLKYRP